MMMLQWTSRKYGNESPFDIAKLSSSFYGRLSIRGLRRMFWKNLLKKRFSPYHLSINFLFLSPISATFDSPLTSKNTSFSSTIGIEMSTPPTNRMECTKDTCGVEYSVYGYYPSQPVTIILIALFAISCGVHLFQGIKYKSWTFMIGLAIGTFMEAVGYVGRILLRNDPFSRV